MIGTGCKKVVVNPGADPTVVLYVSPRHPLYTDVKTLILKYFKLKK
jgi:hypothetical protein